MKIKKIDIKRIHRLMLIFSAIMFISFAILYGMYGAPENVPDDTSIYILIFGCIISLIGLISGLIAFIACGSSLLYYINRLTDKVSK